MKTRLYALLGLIAILFMAPSCNKNEVEEATLELSKKELKFAKAGGEETLTVTTNKEKWVATSPAEGQWLTLTASGNSLMVKAAVNTKGTARKSYVLFQAGDATVKVDEEQSAADVVVTAIPGSLELPMTESEKRIDVESNAGDFTIEVEGDWLTAKAYSHFIDIKAKANDKFQPRTGNIILKSGGKSIQVSVKQAGTMMLPLLSDKAGIREVKMFEEGRGNIVTGAPDGLFNPSAWTFSTPSKDMPTIVYSIPKGAVSYENVQTAMLEEKFKSENMEKVLTDLGFAKQKGSTATAMTFINEKLNFKLTVAMSKGAALMTFSYLPKQTKDYPTFDKFPYTKIEFLNKVKYDAVKKYEDEQKYKETSHDDGSAMFEGPKGARSLIRIYFFAQNSAEHPVPPEKVGFVEEEAEAYAEYTKAVWLHNGKPMVTKEFAALLEKEGFAFIQQNAKGVLFYGKPHNGKTLIIAFRAAQFSDVNPGNTTLLLNFFEQEADGASAKLLMNNPKKYVQILNEMNKRIERGNKIFSWK